jgi:spermidine synthase
LDKIDYVELDYKLVELAKDLIPDDRRISLFKQDGVAFINQAPQNYDAIIINLPSPSTANLNRFYTLEFFEKCKKRLAMNRNGSWLAQNGILTFHLETSESYMGRELKRLNQSIYKTFAQAFKNTLVIPGNYNYFFGSDGKLTDDRADLIHRWRSRNIKTTYFRTDTLYYILWPDKLDYVRKAVQFDQNTRTNTELRPVSYLYQLMLWSSHFNSPLVGIFLSAGNINFVPALIFVLSLLIALRLFSKPGTRLPIVIALLGFAGMATQMIIIYTFQSLHGYLYQNIGLLTAIFMAGLAIGATLAGRVSDEGKSLRIIIVIFALYLLFLLIGLKSMPLYLASFLTALPVGAAFPLAVKIQGEQKTGIGKLAGILYGADLSGSAFAAILASIFFIPVYGIINAGLIAFLSVLCALAFFR